MISLDLTRTLLSEQKLKAYKTKITEAKEKLFSGNEDFTGWVMLPKTYDKANLQKIIETATEIRAKCNAFVVIGIGGSYLGAKAAISALTPQYDNSPEIYFAGQNLSGTYHKELLDKLKDKEVCICVISKSGTTTEASVAFAILKDFIYKKYGKEEGNRRIYAITDAKKGILREETDREGYVSFVVPDDIGGRYSVLTAVGLLPIAVAGIDIEKIMAGALASLENYGKMAEELASARVSLFESGKTIEIFEYYEPRLRFFSEWLKQLFGESEGKQGKGIFPAALQFSTDLHSMGQFLQEGNQIFFETVININDPESDLIVPESAGELLAGKSMNQINQAAVSGVVAAHQLAGIPIIKIDIKKLDEEAFGQMVYFFETTCALSGYIAGVNPFDQPGVESYKSEMRKALNGEKKC